ncbi:MAG: hypothetical protein J6U96_03380 [Elusimicrobiaceae bacterium]|nr:hypothetical protein [Elusimicrobiaceae bacterium]
MDKDKLMALLRNPKKFQKKRAERKKNTPPAKPSRIVPVLLTVVAVLVLLSLIFILYAQYKAENIPAFIDKKSVKGLAVDRSFTPYSNRRYIQISEGADRNVWVKESGSTLPVISRFNFRALTKDNYQVIGAAPWALSINISANAQDPELLRYLFNQDEMIQAFIARPDVAPLLNDPVALARLAGDEQALQNFFAQEAAQKILNSPKLIEIFGSSRLMSYLLISQSARYYREHPGAAAQLVRSSPTLSALKQNPAVRKAVTENYYLKGIAPILLQ